MTPLELILDYNFDRPRIEILLDLVYAFNREYRLQKHQVKFGAVLSLDSRPDILDDENTSIRAVVDRNVDYRLNPNNTAYLYRRLPLAALANVTNGGEIVPLSLPFSTYDILPQINAQLGTQLSEEDLEDTVYTTIDDWFVIRAKADATNWIGYRRIDVVGAGPKEPMFPVEFLQGFFAYTGDEPARPYTGASARRVLTIANRTNNTLWRLGIDFEWGTVEEVAGPGGRNTRIEVIPYVEGYRRQWLYYRRQAVSEIEQQPSENFSQVDFPDLPFTSHDLIDEINRAYKVSLLPHEVILTTYTTEEESYVVNFSDQSEAWLYGALTITRIPANVRMESDDGFYRVTSENGEYRVTE